MNRRHLPSLPPTVFLAAAVLAACPASAQTLPTLTYTETGFGTTTLLGTQADYHNYTFNITGFSGVVSDPTDFYTIYSFKNSSIESSANFYGLAPFSLPEGWTFTDPTDFIISTDARGIHATDPIFGLSIFQKAGTPAIDLNGAPFTLYHQDNGVDPFLNPDGSLLTIHAEAVPEASSLASFGLLLLGGGWTVKRRLAQ